MAKTLRDHLYDFSDHLKKLKKASATVLAYSKDVEQFIEVLRQNHVTDPAAVVPGHVQHFADDLREKRYTDKSIVRKLNSIKGFFRFLESQGVVTVNPVNTIRKPSIDQGIPRVLSKLEYRGLRDVCRSDRRISAVVETLLQTGMRISELAMLKMEDLDLEKKTLMIRSLDEEVASRTIPLNNAAARALEDYLTVRPKTREKTLFITKTCKPFLVRNIRAAIDRYFKLAGVEGAKVNDLRHTFIVEQLSAGTPLVYVSQLVGHKRLSTTEKYLQFIGKQIDTSTVKIEEL